MIEPNQKKNVFISDRLKDLRIIWYNYKKYFSSILCCVVDLQMILTFICHHQWILHCLEVFSITFCSVFLFYLQSFV